MGARAGSICSGGRGPNVVRVSPSTASPPAANASSAAVSATTVVLTTPSQADASQVATGWYQGSWRCNIDGRPAQMRWEVRSKTVQNCRGNICSQYQTAYYQGWFSDNGSRFVPLTHVSSSSSTLTLRHADGNTWFLPWIGRYFRTRDWIDRRLG